jgi:hypothetical protein
MLAGMATMLKAGETPDPGGDVGLGPAYAQDFAGWAFHQAALLKAGQWQQLDVAGIAEELETLGRGEFSELVSQLRIVLLHMLKWDYQAERRSRSWVLSLQEHRLRAADVLAENPSLKPRLTEAVARAHGQARLAAARETGLPLATFPAECPYDWQAITSRPFTLDGETL